MKEAQAQVWSRLPERPEAIVVHTFRGSEIIPTYGLNLELGDVLVLVEQCGDWYRGYVKTRRDIYGIFPISFVKLKLRDSASANSMSYGGGANSACSTISTRSSANSNTSEKELTIRESAIMLVAGQEMEDPISQEVINVAAEWKEQWHKIFIESGSSAYQFKVICGVLRELIDMRKELFNVTLTQDQLRELKLRIARKIDWGNRRLSLDLVPRKGPSRLNPNTTGAMELYETHMESTKNAETIRGSGTLTRRGTGHSFKVPNYRAVGYHLLMSVRYFSYPLNDDCEIYFSLYDGTRGQFISERFMVKFTQDGLSKFVDNLSSQGLTIFEDLGFADLSRELYLVVQVIRIGRMSYSESHSSKKSSQLYKRPFAAGVYNVTHIVDSGFKSNSEPGSENADIAISNSSNAAYPGDGNNDGDTVSAIVNADSLSDDDQELNFKLYQCDEKDFYQLHDLLIKKHMSKVSLVTAHNNVAVSLKLLTGNLNLNNVRKENPLFFGSKISSIVTTKKLGFPDVIMPGDVRNDMYLILESGEFEKSAKTHGRNIEVTVMAFDVTAEDLNTSSEKEKVCLTPAPYIHSSGDNGLEEYQSVVLYHHNCPKWNETIRLSIPIEKFPNTHIRVEYRHCSTKEKNEKKLFGFSFLKLMDEEGTTLKDGSHELHVYKCEDRNKLKDPRSYLNLPCLAPSKLTSSSGNSASSILMGLAHHTSASSNSLTSVQAPSSVIGNQFFQRSAKETLNISTLLVSTKLTQNMDLVSLLKWKSHPDKVRETLKNVASLSGEEIVKFLQDVLDVLFAMFLSEDGESNDFSGNVFIVLVNIFSLLEDAKYEHFKPVIDKYINNHFAAALVYKGLLSSVRHYAEVAHTAAKEPQQQIKKCFETVEYIFKFIIQSHSLFTRATGGEVRDSLIRDVQLLFGALTNMLGRPTPAASADNSLTQIQIATLDNLHKMYIQLLRVIPSLEITRLLVTLFATMELKESIDSLQSHKMKAILQLVISDLFIGKDTRSMILSEASRHIRHHLACRFDLPECTAILGDILTFLYSKPREEIHGDIEILATLTLEMLVQSILRLEKNIPIVESLVTCLIGILQQMDQFHYNRLWDEFGDRISIKRFLQRIFLVFRDIIQPASSCYKKEWIYMKLVANSMILKSLEQFSQALTINFLCQSCFDFELWDQYYNLVVTFITQPVLQLEQFRQTKSDEIRNRYGDMRVKMGDQAIALWDQLGENKIMFIPSLVGPFLDMTLVPAEELRYATIGIFYDMLDMEVKYFQSFKQVESELIDKLDMFISKGKSVGEETQKGKGDDSYRILFSKILIQRLNDCNPPWKESGINFVTSVTKLLERLLDYRNVLEGDENRDKRLFCTVNLLNFYKTEIDRPDMYLRYIYKLHELHCQTKDYVEAGFTLLLHGKVLSWENNEGKLPKQFIYGEPQTELQRKETIYLKAIEYFDLGKLWEEGIPLCKELAGIYENVLYDYTKLSRLLKTEAKFFENILNEMRPEQMYFLIKFYPNNFPSFVRDKEFIYRGRENEKLGDVRERIKEEWPDAVLYHERRQNGIIPPVARHEKVVQIVNAKPQQNKIYPINSRGIAKNIKAYYLQNNIATFQIDTGRFVGDNEECVNLWTMRQSLTVSAQLPGIVRWFKVIDKKIEELPPVRNAWEAIEGVNTSLKEVVEKSQTGALLTASMVQPILNGPLNSSVQGGVIKYLDTFLTNDFVENADPDWLLYVQKLYNAILEQMSLLEVLLGTHAKLGLPEFQGLHNLYAENFGVIKEKLHSCACKEVVAVAKGKTSHLLRSESQRDSFRKGSGPNSIINTPLPPVPKIIKKLGQIDQSSSLSISNRSSTSSGYGHFIGDQDSSSQPNAVAVSRYLIPSDDDDEDFYAKPNEAKVNQIVSQVPFDNKSRAANERNGHRDSGVDSNTSSAVETTTLSQPPPIPSRNTKKQLVSQCSVESKYNNINNGSSGHTPTEYIVMPPSRLRELSNEVANISASSDFLSGNESFYSADGSPLATSGGPPLPPKSSGSLNSSTPPPQLPKRLPKCDKNHLTPMSSISSTASGTGRSGTPTNMALISNSPLSPSRATPPPVPPKPRPQSTNNTTGTLLSASEDYELLPPISGVSPKSPSYEQKFEENSTMLTSAVEDSTAFANNGYSYVTVTKEIGEGSDGPSSFVIVASGDSTANNASKGNGLCVNNVCSGNGKGIERRRSNKEYYELPVVNKLDRTKGSAGENSVIAQSEKSEFDTNITDSTSEPSSTNAPASEDVTITPTSNEQTVEVTESSTADAT